MGISQSCSGKCTVFTVYFYLYSIQGGNCLTNDTCYGINLHIELCGQYEVIKVHVKFSLFFYSKINLSLIILS